MLARRGLTVLGSVDPSPRALRFPFGGGLESTLRLRVSSERVGGLRTSKMDSECADDGPGCSSDIRCTSFFHRPVLVVFLHVQCRNS